MIMNVHPAFILIAIGILAAMAPKVMRKMILSCGPVLAILAMFGLSQGTDMKFAFLNDYTMYYLHVDALSWIFGFIFCIMAFTGGVFACNNDNRVEALCSMWYIAGSLGVVFAKDWITFLFFWESMAATSLFLIWCDKRPGSRGAGFRYILVHTLSGNLILFGVVAKLVQGQPLISTLSAGPHDVAFWLILAGVCINVAMVPLHAWLVDAYPSATITGSVFMSSYTTKVAVYALLRIFAGTDWLIWGGVLMALYGACYAIMENDMLKLLSYHIISQVGFMVAGVGIGTAMAMNGATAHAFCDILFKSLLFMCCNALIYATGVRKINELGGMGKRYPVVFICFLVGAFSISGLPLFNGFVSKTITIAAAGAAGYSLVELLLELASIGTLMSIAFKMTYFIFLAPDKGLAPEKRAIPSNMNVAMCIGAALCIFYGCFPQFLYQYLPFNWAEPYVPYTVAHITLTLEMSLIALVPFIMYLPKMEPHTALSIDTDWFYRKPFPVLVKFCTYLGFGMCRSLGNAWGTLADNFMGICANPMRFLDAKPHHIKKNYNPENYRTAIADPIMIILTVLFVSICYLVTKL